MTDHLRAGLEADADIYDVPPGDLDRVKSHGRRRDQRRRRLTGTVAVLAIVAGTFTAVRMADDQPAANVATEPGGMLGDSGIAWERVADPAAALGGLWQWPAPVDTDGGVYALSTAPGQRDSQEPAQRVVWHSEDGVEWAPLATPDSFWMTDLSADDDRLYAVGTGPATRTTSGRTVHDLRVGSKAPGSDAWEQQALPLDVAAIAERTTSLHVSGMDVAAGPQGIVAAVTLRGELDVRSLLGVEAPNGWTITAEGINVLGDDECPPGTNPSRGRPEAEKAADAPPPAQVYGAYCDDDRTRTAEEVHGVASSHSWAELDLPADVLDAVLGQPFTFHSSDGGATFERVTLPASAATYFGGPAYVEPVDGGFLYVSARQMDMNARPQVEVLRSVDGRTWEGQADAIPGMHHIAAIGTVDGRLALVGHGAPSALYAELHPDGWRVTSLADVLGLDGENGVYVGSADIGPLGVVIGAGVSDGDRSVSRIVASRDGQVWSSESLADIAGRDDLRGVSQIIMRGDRVVLSVRTGAPEQEVTGRMAVVGTPR